MTAGAHYTGGTNVHWLRLLDDTSAATNTGTAGNWTASGTLQTAATEPTEGVGPTYTLTLAPAVTICSARGLRLPS